MIFTGDIACTFVGAFSTTVPIDLQSKTWLGNLEGSLIEVSGEMEDIRGVYNDFEAIKGLRSVIPFAAFNIANNH